MFDSTNREGLAAKVHFNALFGLDFNRREKSNINDLLNYGYAMILSCFNREIVQSGYLTQIGIFHKGKTNPFNLACDFMEPFRPVVDIVVHHSLRTKDPLSNVKKLLTYKINIGTEERFIDDAIRVYVLFLLRFINEEDGYIPPLELKESAHYQSD